jgi:hypothetical protein
MGGKDAKSKSDRKVEGANVLEKLDNAETASVLRKLLDRHSELRFEAEAIASGMLAEISPFSVADEVEDALLQFDYDDLNGRAGSHSWGYVEPSEAAGELLEEALEPFVNDMKRHLEMGLEDQAAQFCTGNPPRPFPGARRRQKRHSELGAGLSGRGGSQCTKGVERDRRGRTGRCARKEAPPAFASVRTRAYAGLGPASQARPLRCWTLPRIPGRCRHLVQQRIHRTRPLRHRLTMASSGRLMHDVISPEL